MAAATIDLTATIIIRLAIDVSLAICDIYLMPIHLICIRFVSGYILELDPNELTYCSDGIFASARGKKK